MPSIFGVVDEILFEILYWLVEKLKFEVMVEFGSVVVVLDTMYPFPFGPYSIINGKVPVSPLTPLFPPFPASTTAYVPSENFIDIAPPVPP